MSTAETIVPASNGLTDSKRSLKAGKGNHPRRIRESKGQAGNASCIRSMPSRLSRNALVPGLMKARRFARLNNCRETIFIGEVPRKVEQGDV